MAPSAQRTNVSNPDSSSDTGIGSLSVPDFVNRLMGRRQAGDSTNNDDQSAQRSNVEAPTIPRNTLVASAQRGNVGGTTETNPSENQGGFNILRFFGIAGDGQSQPNTTGTAQRGNLSAPPVVVSPTPAITPIPNSTPQPANRSTVRQAPVQPSSLMLGRTYPGYVLGVKDGMWPRGDDVKAIQYRLTRHGIQVDQDGIFGPNTRAAIIAFQNAKGLKADGLVGPNTWKALFSA